MPETVSDKLNELILLNRTAFQGIQREFEKLEKNVEDLTNIIKGGGNSDGLTSKLSVQINRLDAIDEQVDGLESFKWKMVWSLIGLLASVVGTLVTTFVLAKP